MVAVNMLAYVNKIWPQETLVGASLADRPYTVFYAQYAAQYSIAYWLINV